MVKGEVFKFSILFSVCYQESLSCVVYCLGVDSNSFIPRQPLPFLKQLRSHAQTLRRPISTNRGRGENLPGRALPFLDQVRLRAAERSWSVHHPSMQRPLPFLEQIQRRLGEETARESFHSRMYQRNMPPNITGSGLSYSASPPHAEGHKDDRDVNSSNESVPICVTTSDGLSLNSSLSSVDQTRDTHNHVTRTSSLGRTDTGASKLIDLSRRLSLNTTREGAAQPDSFSQQRRRSFSHHKRRSSEDLSKTEELGMMRSQSNEKNPVSCQRFPLCTTCLLLAVFCCFLHEL